MSAEEVADALIAELGAAYELEQAHVDDETMKLARQLLAQPGRGAGLPPSAQGWSGRMDLSLLLIVLGIIVAVLVHQGLGVAMILIGLVLLLWPRLRASL